MTEKVNLKNRIRAIITLAVIFVMLIAMNCRVFAADDDYTYYPTWAEYKEANGIASDSETTWAQEAEVICANLDYAVRLWEEGKVFENDGKTCTDGACAYCAVNQGGYYGYYETTGFERNIKAISGSRCSQVELQFKTCRKMAKAYATKGEGTLEEFKAEIETLKQMMREDAITLDGGDASAASATSSSTGTSSSSGTSGGTGAVIFAASFSIILREGFEAIIIVGAIIAYLQASTGSTDKAVRRKKAMPVYVGSIIGIIMSFALAWLLNAIKLANTASQEIIEGVTALLAVCVLYYVSNWMLSKSETDAWIGYIKKKTSSSSERGSMFALAFTAFLAVFREGAEVVLFYQPYLASDYAAYQGNLWAGFIIGACCLVVVYLIIHLLSVKIPVKGFFTATSILMFIMSISFLGAGIKELIEGNVIEMTSPVWLQGIIPYTDLLDVLGIYPILETLIPQLILLIVTIVIFVVVTKKNRKIHAEAEARRAEERAVKEAEEKAAREEALTSYITGVVNKILADKGLIRISEEEIAGEVQNMITEQAGDAVANAGDIAKGAINS